MKTLIKKGVKYNFNVIPGLYHYTDKPDLVILVNGINEKLGLASGMTVHHGEDCLGAYSDKWTTTNLVKFNDIIQLSNS